MSQFLNILREMNILIENLAEGQTKFAGIIRILPTLPARRIDIRIVRPEEYVFTLLHFTGSKKLNTLMRTRAIQLGAKLNEYGVFDYTGRLYSVETEEQIFSLLGIVYVPPNKRVKDIAGLEFINPLIRVGF